MRIGNHVVLGTAGALLLVGSAVAITGGRGISQQGTFLQSGTGATLRTIESKERDFVSVKDFGAVGDGVADDTAAIQAAVTAAGVLGGVAYAPPGTYKITSSITVGHFTTLSGAGIAAGFGAGNRFATTILKSGSFDGILLSGSGASVVGIHIDGDVANGGDGILLTGLDDKIQDVTVTTQGGVGIRVGGKVNGTNANNWSLSRIVTINNTSHGVYVHDAASSGGPNANAGTLVNLDTRSNGGDGLRVEKALLNTFVGIISQLNTGWGVNVTPGTATTLYNNFFGGDYESNSAGAFQLAVNAQRNTVVYSAPNGVTNLGFANLVADSWIIKGGISPFSDAEAPQAGRVYQGSGVPGNGNGNNGDVYFRTDTPGTANQRMYIKSAGAWVALTL